MRALTPAELLTVWEQGRQQSPLQRALLLLTTAGADCSPEHWANLPIGQRDAQLLTLRESMLGPQLDCQLTCPQCQERLELPLTVADIWAEPPVADPESLTLTLDGYTVTFRLPNSLDLVAIDCLPTLEVAQLALLERCLVTARMSEEDCPPDRLPDSVLRAISDRMAAADPQANVQLQLTCPHCHHAWQPSLDIVTFFWQEIDVWAQRLLQEVHQLASAYHWSEAEILALSPLRRQYYLELTAP
jgi:hypothetical protein